MSTLQNAAIQVPCFFLLCALVWKLGALAINKWAQGDAERTKVFAKGEADRTIVLAKGFADITAELKHHGERLGRIEDWIDVRGVIADPVEDIRTGPIRAVDK